MCTPGTEIVRIARRKACERGYGGVAWAGLAFRSRHLGLDQRHGGADSVDSLDLFVADGYAEGVFQIEHDVDQAGTGDAQIPAEAGGISGVARCLFVLGELVDDVSDLAKCVEHWAVPPFLY